MSALSLHGDFSRLFLKVLFGMIFWLAACNVATAAQTVVKAVSCSGCTAEQMRQTAIQKTGFGIGYVYDLDAAVIRKFEVFADSTCLVFPWPSDSSATSAPRNQSDSSPGVSPNCGSYRDAQEWAPDASVQTIYDSMVEVYRAAPALLSSYPQEKIYLHSLPNDPSTGRPFDLSQVAWQYPQGAFYRFVGTLQNIFSSYNSLSQYSPWLAKLIFKIQIPSGSVSIGLSGTTPTGNVQVNWDKNSSTSIQICDSDSNCANFKITVANGNATLDYVDVRDMAGNIYPQPNSNSPSNPTWRWDGARTEGPTFAGGLRNNGVPVNDGIGLGSCRSGVILTCAWQGGKLMGCVTQCY